jgi:protein-tyrosine phosphatase
MAQALLRHRLEDVDDHVTVTSAGLYEGGRPATPHGVATMKGRGLDLVPHRSRKVGSEMLQAADLIIGMSREHVREVAVVEPSAADRSFTLKDLVRLGELAGGREPGEQLSAWLARISVARRRDDLVGVGHDDTYDIADPVGLDRADYEATADELDGLLARLVALLWATSAAHEQGRSA